MSEQKHDDPLHAWNKLKRLLLSVRDFQQALSAATFLYDEMDEARGLIALRRLRCFETSMVVAYARPFSQARGAVGKLTFEDLDAPDIPENRMVLHGRIIHLRNKLHAHSDADMVPMSITVWNTIFDKDRPTFQFVKPEFDEGVTFASMEVLLIQDLCHRVHGAALMKAQALGKDFVDRFPSFEIDLSASS